MPQVASIILAAGQGTRMKSKYSKVLQPLLGRPMLQYVVEAARNIGSLPNLIVVGFEGDRVIETMGPDLQYIWQRQQLGTGHAIMMAREILTELSGDLLVLYGDTPLLKEETLQALIDSKRSSQSVAAVLTTLLNDPVGYGRITRDSSGNISAIVEDKDATALQKEIKEVNTGVYCFDIKTLLEALNQISPRNAQGEYYLTDVFKVLVQKGLKVSGLLTNDAEEVMGPNDRAQLAQTENYLKTAINNRWMRQGITIQDPQFTYIGPEVELERDTIILPGTFLLGKTRIGENCVIGPHTRIINSSIEAGSEVQFSQIVDAHLGPENIVGPYAYIRPGTVTAGKVKIGDFVELKNVHVSSGSKVPHLSYLGDAEVGADVNVGAGTITCNYDGLNKHRTIIKDGAFIGSNANLVAPVVIEANATVAAGSTITENVPANALAIARNKQENLLHWKSPRERAGK